MQTKETLFHIICRVECKFLLLFFLFSLVSTCVTGIHLLDNYISSLSTRLIKVTAANADVHKIISLLNWITQCGRKEIEQLLVHILFHGGENIHISTRAHSCLYTENVEKYDSYVWFWMLKYRTNVIALIVFICAILSKQNLVAITTNFFHIRSKLHLYIYCRGVHVRKQLFSFSRKILQMNVPRKCLNAFPHEEFRLHCLKQFVYMGMPSATIFAAWHTRHNFHLVCLYACF